MNKIITLLIMLTLFVGCNEEDPKPIKKKVTATSINEARIPEPKVIFPDTQVIFPEPNVIIPVPPNFKNLRRKE